VITAAITVHVPPGAKARDRFRLDVIQRQRGRVIGGSTYIIAIARPKRR
jgi:hypothetical protein